MCSFGNVINDIEDIETTKSAIERPLSSGDITLRQAQHFPFCLPLLPLFQGFAFPGNTALEPWSHLSSLGLSKFLKNALAGNVLVSLLVALVLFMEP